MPDEDATAPAEVRLRRSFGWGVLFIGDAEASTSDLDADSSVTWSGSGSGAAVLVRHAQDVDAAGLDLGDDDITPLAEVTVVIHREAAGARQVDADGHIAVPSGRLTVGDADDEDVIAVTPGCYPWTEESWSTLPSEITPLHGPDAVGRG